MSFLILTIRDGFIDDSPTAGLLLLRISAPRENRRIHQPMKYTGSSVTVTKLRRYLEKELITCVSSDVGTLEGHITRSTGCVVAGGK